MEVAGSSWEKWTFELIKFKFLKSLDRGRSVCVGGGERDRERERETDRENHILINKLK